ncbi:hypothetical protein PAALTS15_20628 [Paenibacillus alvei TS-15]|uniref:Uncharacterized protein n=1 Tax=Paenibacillus alvei TS-15 TaxID=1117108 RepID=S9TSP6_PAEAL|nr:hypothetical protein [Paenibacillus alvei]EPY05336.1 hypothetical protein PAALTS15_20628 [Paenibacillus alvei TS-15]
MNVTDASSVLIVNKDMRKSTLVSAFSIFMKRAAHMAGDPKLLFLEAWTHAGDIDEDIAKNSVD